MLGRDFSIATVARAAGLPMDKALAQLDEALGLDIDVILLDNMDLEMLREAARRARGRVLTEASGGIRPENVRAVAETGVDLISLGWLTHSAPSLDVALDLSS